MKSRCAFALIALTLALAAACGGKDDAPGATATIPASATGGTTALPTTPPRGGPEAGAYTTKRAYPQLDLKRMVWFETIPGDAAHALVLTQDGTIVRAGLERDAAPEMFLDVRDLIIDNPGNEEGLLGLAFAPDYQTSGHFYIYYSAGPPRFTVLARYTASGNAADPSSAQILLEVEDPFSNHNGGQLAFGPDGFLYVGIGDGGSGGDPQGNGQNKDALLGKILRLDVARGEAYAIPADNPFAAGGGRGEVWAYGFRNPWRFSFDTETGALWAGDVGESEYEEVDLVQGGGNYGWNIMEADDCFNSDNCDRAGLILPRAAYDHDEGCSVTGGFVYRGAAMPELDGWYVYGDYCSGRVWALDTTDSASEPVVLIDEGNEIASFGVDPAGELLMITFDDGIQRLIRS